MKPTTTLALLVVASAMGAYIYFVERGRAGAGDAGEARKLLPDFARDKVARLAITRADGPVTLEKGKDDAWTLVRPAAAPADRSAVDAILSGLEFLEHQRKIAEGGARARPEFGLESPQATLEVTGASGGAVKLVLGKLDATERSVYLARGDDPQVYVVEKNFLDTLTKPLGDLRDKKALALERSRVTALTIADEDGRWAARKEQGLWRLAEPTAMAASGDKLEEVLGRIDDLRATRHVADGLDELGKYGLDTPARTVEVDDGAAQALLIGGPCTGFEAEVYAARRGRHPGVFCVKAEDVRGLDVELSQIELRRLFAVKFADLARARIQEHDVDLHLAKDGDAWQVTAPAKVKADGETIQKWLEDLSAFRAAEVAPAPERPAALGLARPTRVELETAGGAKVALAFGDPVAGFRWVRRDGEPVVLKVHADVAAHLRASVSKFRDRTVLSFARYDVTGYRAAGGGVIEEAIKKDGKWALVQPAFDVDENALDRNVGHVAELKAQSFADPPAGAFSAGRKIEVTVEPPPGAEGAGEAAAGKATHFVEVGGPVPGEDRCYARTRDLGFTITRAVCDDLRAPVGTLDLFDLEDEKVIGVALRRPDGEQGIEKLGPDWHLTSGPKVDKAKVDELLAYLRGQKARALLRYGVDPAAAGLASPRLVVTLRHEGRKDQVLTVGKEHREGAGQAGYLARYGARDATYVVDQAMIDNVEGFAFE